MTLQGSLGPARWWFTSRTGGVSLAPFSSLNLASHVGDDPLAVAANRQRVADLAGAPLVVMGPTHGVGVATVRDLSTAVVEGVDSLVTDVPGIALLALAADCVPVVVVDPQRPAVAAVHAGWPGVRDGVVAATIERLVADGSHTSDLTVILGPAICGACYPVPQERFEQVVAVVPRAAARSRDGQPALDLRAGLAQWLHEFGIAVDVVGPCVAEDPEWFSYRRDGRTGRNGAVAVLVE